MNIKIDERIELMTVVQTLCNYWENLSMNFYNSKLYQCKYKDNIKNYFGKHEGHEITKLFNILVKDIRDISAFINLALCHSQPPQLNSIADYEYNFGKINDSIFPYEEFINGLKQFYIDTNFEEFFKKNQEEYFHILNNYGDKTELQESKILNYLENKDENYNIIISPLVMGCFGIKVNTYKNETFQYSIISPYDYKEDNYTFDSAFKKELIWHEIGHLTINDLTKKYLNQFNVDKKQVPEIFINNLYTNIETIINEYIIRAITIRLFEMNGENKTAGKLMANNSQKGFQEIELIKNFIKENCEENNKLIKGNKYKDLMEYVISKI